MSTNSITLKIDQELLNEVRTIAQNKFPLRNITFYAEAVREALIDFVKRNKNYYNKDLNQDQTETILEERI